jgi:amidase
VVGFKPPHGRNPDGAPWNLDPFSHCGPLARTVGDVALVQNVVSGPHPLDHDSLRDRVHLPVRPDGIKGFRIAFSVDLGYRQVDPDVRKNTHLAVEVFRQLGCQVREVTLDWTAEIDRAFGGWFKTLPLGRTILRLALEHPDLLSDDLRRLAAAMRDEPEGVASRLDVANGMYASLGPVLDRHEVFICPTMTVPAVAADHRMFAEDFRIDGKLVEPRVRLFDHPPIQHPAQLPGHERAFRFRRHRRADGDPDCRPHLRRSQRVPCRPRLRAGAGLLV